MLRRMKSDVLTDSMPTKKWVEVPCALTDSQRELYIDILEKNYSKLNGAIRNGQCKYLLLHFPLWFIVIYSTFTWYYCFIYIFDSPHWCTMFFVNAII
jgi:SNF2 family DNA or RNA helicase